jgi:hypothetical protein
MRAAATANVASMTPVFATGIGNRMIAQSVFASLVWPMLILLKEIWMPHLVF